MRREDAVPSISFDLILEDCGRRTLEYRKNHTMPHSRGRAVADVLSLVCDIFARGRMCLRLNSPGVHWRIFEPGHYPCKMMYPSAAFQYRDRKVRTQCQSLVYKPCVTPACNQMICPEWHRS